MKTSAAGFAACVIVILFSVYSNGCKASFPQVALKPDYSFATNHNVGVYVVPSGRETLDEIYARTFKLDMQSRGYSVTNVNTLLNAHGDSLAWTDHRSAADTLLTKSYLSDFKLVAVVRPQWDTVLIITYFSKSSVGYTTTYSFRGVHSLRLKCEAAFFDRSIREPVLAFAAMDTSRVFHQQDRDDVYYFEFPWMTVARQLTMRTKDIPLCVVENSSPAKNRLNLSLWVDKSYREKFPAEWKQRLGLRVLYANDILRSQFDTELRVTEVREWDARFDKTLDKTLLHLQDSLATEPPALRVGVTLDDRLRTDWTSRSLLGLAVPLGTDAVVTAQPSYPDLSSWNSLEEALTLVHEIGHLLGAIHLPDEQSVMFPSAGFLSDEFDDVNRRIVQATNSDFLDLPELQRVQKYAQVFVELRKTPARNSIPMLETLARASLRSPLQRTLFFPDPKRLAFLLSKAISDTVLSEAVLAFVEFKTEQLERARTHFSKVLASDPDFAEAHWYLGQVLEQLKDREQAERHKRMAVPFKKNWVLED